MIHLPTISVLILSFLNLAEMMIAQAEIIVKNWMNKTQLLSVELVLGQVSYQTLNPNLFQKSRNLPRFSAVENNGSSEP